MKKGFTLVELVFAIVIIGILSSVAVSRFSGVTDNAKMTSELSIGNSVKTAIEGIHGKYVMSMRDIDWDNDSTIDETDRKDNSDLTGSTAANSSLYELTYRGYPVALEQYDFNTGAPIDSQDSNPFSAILDNVSGWQKYRESDWTSISNCQISTASSNIPCLRYYKGPASNADGSVDIVEGDGTTGNKGTNKPDKNDFWLYNAITGKFKLIDIDSNEDTEFNFATGIKN